MKYLPFEDFILTTPLTVHEVQKLLTEKVETMQGSLFGNSPKTNKPYRGEVTSESFRIYRIINYRNSFLPEITGRYKTNDNGTQIQIKMRPNTGVLVFMSIWLGLVGIVCIVIFVVMLMSMKEVFKGGFSPMVLIPFGMFVFGYGLVTLGFKSESSLSKNYLIKILTAEEEPNIKVS
jgi:hypothetical protein